MSEKGLREAKREATGRELARVSFELVRENGFAGVTVDDIAAAANVSRRTFSNYFACKEAAVAAVIGHQAEDALASWVPPTTLRLRPVELVRDLVLHQIAHRTMASMAVIGQLSRAHPQLVPFVRTEQWRAWQKAGERLREVTTDDQLDPLEIDAVMGAVFGAVAHALAAETVTPGDDLPRMLDHVLTRLDCGFGGR